MMEKSPLVSVICTCYNQAPYVVEALDSVVAQSYPHIELIVIDDASTDDSASRIRQWQKRNPAVLCIFHLENQGICASFNEGFRQSTGTYLVDFAADDLMLPERIAEQVAFFQASSTSVGVVYSNILWINAQGIPLQSLYQQPMPQGKVFEKLLAKSFIAAPSMMSRRQVFEALDGYNEALAYEDLDFWFRSARHWEYGYIPQILTLVRKSNQSFSTQFNQVGNAVLFSAYRVCQQTMMGLNARQQKALAQRIERYLYRAFFTHHFTLVLQLAELLPTPKKKLIYVVTYLAKGRLKTNGLFRHYCWLKAQVQYIFQPISLWKILLQSIPFS